MRLRDYLLAAFLALVVVAVGLGIDAARSSELPVRHVAAASDDMPGPLPMPPPASVTFVFEAPCGDTAGILDVQRELHGQVPAGGGRIDPATSLLLLVAPSGSWSLIALTGAGDLACGVASGGNWRSK